MGESSDADRRRVNRRTALGALAGGVAAGTTGCIREVRSVVNRDGPEQLSLRILTPPADDDRMAIQIATELAGNLNTVGIDATVDPVSITELRRNVLINTAFDLYVGRHPGGTDPDFLYEALHSVFADEPGWQNPFGFTNLTFDELLEEQRRQSGDRRRYTVAQLLRSLTSEQPFISVCVPDDVRLVRDDRFRGWTPQLLADRLGYLGLEAVGDGDVLELVVTDARATENLNPLAVEYRNRGLFVDLLYDSLGVSDGEEIRPWLARSWGWDGSDAVLTLRDGLHWHDGVPLTASDVAFTYRFIDDTSLEDGSVPVPSPRYRGLTSLVEDVSFEDRAGSERRLIRISFADDGAANARAFTVPILPKHVWGERTGPADLPGVDAPEGTTEAIVTDNVEPVGSGPYAFVERTERERIVFERFEDHFTLRSDVDRPAPTADRLLVHVAPRSASAIELIRAGDADATVSPIEAHRIDDLEETDSVSALETRSRTFYHVGFNVRNAPLSNPYFRRAVAGLVDKAWTVEETFEGHAEPIVTPVSEDWTPTDLEWNGFDPTVPFFGSNGNLDEEAARNAFESAGFRYDSDGNLVSGDS